MVDARGWGGGGSECLMGAKFLFRKMKKFWRWTVVMVAQQCNSTQCH